MKKTIPAILLLLLPSVAFAAIRDFKDLAERVVDIINIAIPVVGSLIFLAFAWGVARYVFSTSSVEGKERSRMLLFWGVIALFVAFSIWGIVNLVARTVGVAAY